METIITMAIICGAAVISLITFLMANKKQK